MSTSPSEPPVTTDVAALYFDGRSARAHAVTLRLAGKLLQVVGAEVSRSDALGDVRLSEPMGLAPRLITFADGAHVEVRDHASLARLLAVTGQRDAAHVRWAFDWRKVLLLLGGAAGMCYGWQAGYGCHGQHAWRRRTYPKGSCPRCRRIRSDGSTRG
jgi:hypothetical protein